MENPYIKTLKEIACSAFMEPDFKFDYASRISFNDGIVTSTPIKPKYSVNVENKTNGDITTSAKKFGKDVVTIPQKEQMQYAAYLCKKIDDNRLKIIDAIKKHKGKKLNEIIYNMLTEKDEYVDGISESCNTLASVVEIANEATDSISKINKIAQDEYVLKGTQIIDDFFTVFDSAEREISLNNKKEFNKILQDAYDEYLEYGELNYRFKIDNVLPTNNLSNKLRKLMGKDTDDILLNKCLDTMGKALDNEEFFKIIKNYLYGKTAKAKKEAKTLKTKTTMATAAEKMVNEDTKKYLTKKVLRNLYLGTALDAFYKNIELCSNPERYDFNQKEMLKEVLKKTPKNPIDEMDSISKICLRDINSVNKESAKYVVNRHIANGNIDSHNYRVAKSRISKTNENALLTWAKSNKLFGDIFDR